jgi:hypothetical protein
MSSGFLRHCAIVKTSEEDEFLFFLTTKSCEIEELKLRQTRFSILATGNAKLRAGGGEGVCI